MPRYSLLLASIALLYAGTIFGQKLSYVQGEVIIQLDRKTDARAFSNSQQRFTSNRTSFQPSQQLSKELNIWKFTFDFTLIHEKHFLYHLQKEPRVISAQLNRWVDLRSTIPNDPLFTSQWQYVNTGQSGGITGTDLDIDLAWNITQGGVTPNNDTIVVCVIDNGQEIDHSDFAGNLWINHAEKPGNGLDDDNNGFIDDYRGWNVSKGTDEISADNFHGTPVAGIIGAKGNNGIGVTGVNWHVKIMTITSDFPTTEGEILKAYDYVLQQRKRYNETNGEEGAFVVATNGSWGVPNAQPENSPIWCSFYDQLGEEGILNIVATDNSNIDVDKDGDMPSSCSSDFIISVTNVGNDGKKVDGSGFGSMSVDLGAFGGNRSSGTWTSSTFNDYGAFDGTSASTPHVTGTVALLYAAPCPSISELALADPPMTALLIKDYILNSVVPNASLEGITVAGGHLNVNSAMQYLTERCTDCIAVTNPSIDRLTDTEAQVNWSLNPGIAKIDLRWKAKDDGDWIVVENATSPLQLDGLVGCTEYEFQLKTDCEGESLNYTESFSFSSMGCCEPPSEINFLTIEENLAFGEWNAIFGADQYQIRYREEGTEEWIEEVSFGNNEFFNELNSCTTYEIEIATVCGDLVGEFNTELAFTTLGCGACYESEYCQPRNLDSNEEWIASVTIDTFQNLSQSDDGYGDYTGLGAIKVEINETVEIEIAPGFPDGISFTEFFSVWIDYDQNGIFNPSKELAWSNPEASREVVTASFDIPEDALLGNTRMRIGMLGLSETNSCPSSVVSKFGEYEDYCIEIIETTSTSTNGPGISQPIFNVFPNPAIRNSTFTVETKFPTLIKSMFLEIFGVNGTSYFSTEINNHPANTSQSQLIETASLPPGIYFIRLKSSGKKTLVKKVIVLKG